MDPVINLVYLEEIGEERQTNIQSLPVVTKPKNPRSPVYQFFEWIEETNKWQCTVCKKMYAAQKTGSTGSLNNHMNRSHLSLFQGALTENKETSADLRSNGALEPKYQKITKEIFRLKVITHIVCSDEPFTLVEEPSFRDLINYCSGGNPECQLFCAKTAKGIIEQLYQEHKTNMKNMLCKNSGKISFVIDCWTSSNQFPFQGVIAIWISESWELCSTVLDLTILSGSHSGINIAEAFWKVLKEYDLCTKILGVTTDNASNMDTMFLELESLCGNIFDSKNYRVRCFAHILNLSCRDMINSVGDGDTATYASDSDSDADDENAKSTAKLKELPVVAKLRKGIVAIRKSPQRRELFKRQCIAANIPPKNLIQDCRTRWNTTLDTMERAKELKQPFDLTLRSIPKLRKYILDDDEWQKIDELIVLISPFKEATVMLSNEHSPTISRISAAYQVLFNHLEKYLENEDETSDEPPPKKRKTNGSSVRQYPGWLSTAAEQGWSKLKKYYPSSDGLVYIVGTDPRYKLVWYKATGWPKEWIDHCRKSVTDLYKSQYKSQNGTNHNDQNESVVETERQKPSLFEDLFNKQMQGYQKNSTDDELKKYLNENVVDPDLLVKENTGIDGVLGWWKIHQKEFPNLSKMAKDFLPVSGTGVPVERLFSTGVGVVSPARQSLLAESIRVSVCLKAWLKNKDEFHQGIRDAITNKLGVGKTDL